MRLRSAAGAILLAASALAQGPVTTNNADSCDIAVTPAATLLLPYFEVDTAAPPGGNTTLFTITNTSPYPQIAHVTLWTEWAYPVLGFNIFLTGYDVQGINLFDVIVRGVLVPTSMNTPPGTASDRANAAPFDNTSNPHFIANGDLAASRTCANLPASLPADLASAVRSVLTTGVGGGSMIGCSIPIGGNHPPLAKGYATIDVVSYCTTAFATDANGTYFLGRTAPLLFDNVLLGDYQQLAAVPLGAGTAQPFDAQGNSMVHIRAIPEGGLSGAGNQGTLVDRNLPFTFYDRYTPVFFRTADRRQPLPSTWAARLIQGGAGGLSTELKIWREGVTAGLPSCSSGGNVVRNSVIDVTSIVRFDEHENSTSFSPLVITPNCCPLFPPFFPATSRTSTTSPFLPPLSGSGDVGGWLYLNLSSGSQHVALASFGQVCDRTLSAQRAGFGDSACATAAPGQSGSRSTTQNWVVVSMYGDPRKNRLAVDFDAAWMANGCTPAEPKGARIAPATPRENP
jgi:hypothetical protein